MSHNVLLNNRRTQDGQFERHPPSNWFGGQTFQLPQNVCNRWKAHWIFSATHLLFVYFFVSINVVYFCHAEVLSWLTCRSRSVFVVYLARCACYTVIRVPALVATWREWTETRYIRDVLIEVSLKWHVFHNELGEKLLYKTKLIWPWKVGFWNEQDLCPGPITAFVSGGNKHV